LSAVSDSPSLSDNDHLQNNTPDKTKEAIVCKVLLFLIRMHTERSQKFANLLSKVLELVDRK